MTEYLQCITLYDFETHLKSATSDVSRVLGVPVVPQWVYRMVGAQGEGKGEGKGTTSSENLVL